jgi:hypothetical protein
LWELSERLIDAALVEADVSPIVTLAQIKIMHSNENL